LYAQHLGFVVTSAAEQRRERLAVVSESLRSSIAVPTDTFITEDLPLLLTRLSQIPASGVRRTPEER